MLKPDGIEKDTEFLSSYTPKQRLLPAYTALTNVELLCGFNAKKHVHCIPGHPIRSAMGVGRNAKTTTIPSSVFSHTMRFLINGLVNNEFNLEFTHNGVTIKFYIERLNRKNSTNLLKYHKGRYDAVALQFQMYDVVMRIIYPSGRNKKISIKLPLHYYDKIVSNALKGETFQTPNIYGLTELAELVSIKYPTIQLKSLRAIIKYGILAIKRAITFKAPVYISNTSKFFAYFCENSSVETMTLMRNKIRFLANPKGYNRDSDEYRYLCLSERQYVNFNNDEELIVPAVKLLEEAHCFGKMMPYIYRIKSDEFIGKPGYNTFITITKGDYEAELIQIYDKELKKYVRI